MTVKLEVIEVLPGEIAHHYEPDSELELYSQSNRFWGKVGEKNFTVTLPMGTLKKVQSLTRLSRRLTRTDKSSATFNYARDGVIILYLGQVYFFCIRKEQLTHTGTLKQCRNILHCGFAVTGQGIYFGEYGANPERQEVPLWLSETDGRSWKVVYNFPCGSIKHVHGVYSDPYSDSLWVPTGDESGECGLFEFPSGDVSRVKRHGNGQQQWRPVSMFFERDRIVWGMDSQLQISYLQSFNRVTSELSQGRSFPGPVWYSKQLKDGMSILQSTVEIGPGSRSRYAHLFVSNDLEEWREIARYRKDLYPLSFFKFGVIAFADGDQSSDDFVVFGEALSGLDGKILRVSLR